MPPAESATEWPPARLHVVTGKGGTGKTTVAAALAIALAAGGKRTLLVEVEGRQGIARLFDTAPLPYTERRIAIAPDGGEVYALAVDAEDALLEYLELFYNLRRAGRLLRRVGAIDFATTIAPGLRDVLLTGKVKEAVTRVREGRRRYDAVILDAPPTGRITRFLNVTADVAGLAKAGPIKSQSDGVIAVLRSSLTAVHLVSLLEEMPVQETIDAAAALGELHFPLGAVVVNMVRPREISGERMAEGIRDVDVLGKQLSAVGIDEALAPQLAHEAAEDAARAELERGYRAELDGLGKLVLEVPLQPPPMDLGGLYEIADILRAARDGAT